MPLERERERVAPYPGLRPFRSDERHLFFGREGQVSSMLEKLLSTHFLAVVGVSGSGKSSLVNCGLMPVLEDESRAPGGRRWDVVKFRPGADPVLSLATQLAASADLPATQGDGGVSYADIFEGTLQLSSRGLIDLYEDVWARRGRRLLVIADQFEEFFRYSPAASSADGADRMNVSPGAMALVHLLLQVREERSENLFVAFTMRSDFLGDCAQFSGLPEAMNEGQYLIPRMSREERKAAICEPARLYGVEMAPTLVNRLLNDVGEIPEQLSVLQHALNRTWRRWEQEAGDGERLTLDHYESGGGMHSALDRHADETYESFSPEEKSACKKAFKALTDKVSDARGIRRPTSYGDLRRITECDERTLRRVIEEFSAPDRSFLMLTTEHLDDETIVDISHESLMRVWRRLRRWSNEEAEAVHDLRHWSDRERKHRLEGGDLLSERDLLAALAWQEKARPTVAWAERYEADYARLEEFFRASEAEISRLQHEKEERRRRQIEDLKTIADQQVRLAATQRRYKLMFAAAALLLGVLAGVLRQTALKDKETLRELAFRRGEEMVRTGERAVALASFGSVLAMGGVSESAGSYTLELALRAGWPIPSAPLEHEDEVVDVAFSPDGRRLATASADKLVHFWDLATGKRVAQIDLPRDVISTSFSLEGDRLWALLNDGCVYRLEPPYETGGAPATECEHSGEDASPVAGVFAPAANLAAITFLDLAELVVVDLESRAVEQLSHHGAVSEAAFSPDGKRLASTDVDGVLTLWSRHEDGWVRDGSIADLGRSRALAFSPDGKRLAWGSDDRLEAMIFELDDLEDATEDKGSAPEAFVSLGPIIEYHVGVRAIRFSADGNRVAVASSNTVAIYDAHTGQSASRQFISHEKDIRSIAFSPDGARLATSSNDRTARLWDGRADLPNIKLDHPGVSSVAFGPDGRIVFTKDWAGEIRAWDPMRGELIGVRDPGTKKEDAVFAGVADEMARLEASGNDQPDFEVEMPDGTGRIAVKGQDSHGTLKIMGKDGKARSDEMSYLGGAPSLIAVSPTQPLAVSVDRQQWAHVWYIPAATSGDAEALALLAQFASGLSLDGTSLAPDHRETLYRELQGIAEDGASAAGDQPFDFEAVLRWYLDDPLRRSCLPGAGTEPCESMAR